MGYWRKHPKKDGEALLEEFDRQGWRIKNPPTYYSVRCPCGAHQRQVHLTPSNPRHWQQALNWAKRCPMWKREGDR